MKKVTMLTAAVMMLAYGWVKGADVLLVPSGRGSNVLQSNDYGGVDIATSAFTVGFATGCVVTTAFPFCEGVIHGVYISSDNANSFVDVFDSTTGMIVPTDDKFLFRVYTATTQVSGTNGVNGTWAWMQHPVRFSKGLVFKANVATLNKVSVFFWRRR